MFFVPTKLEHVSLSYLPTSSNLQAALRKIGVRHLRDLNGVSMRDFTRVSQDGHALAREVLQLVEQIRNGSLEIELRDQPAGTFNRRRRKRVGEQKEDSILCISIPDELKHLPISDFCLSTKLAHLFVAKGIIFFGDLHNRRLVEFQSLPIYGEKTVGELLALINDPRSRLWSLQTIQDKRQRRRTIHFFVPEKVRDVNLFELRLTKRLRSALEKIGASTLGELHGLPTVRLQKLINCSNGTINELVSLLNRAAAGEYDSLSTKGSSFDILDFGNLAERVLLEFSSRDQEIILLRFGGKSNAPQTLQRIALSVGVSRERVRQIETDWLQRLQTAGGKKLRSFLREFVPEECKCATITEEALVFCSRLLQQLHKQPSNI